MFIVNIGERRKRFPNAFIHIRWYLMAKPTPGHFKILKIGSRNWIMSLPIPFSAFNFLMNKKHELVTLPTCHQD